MSIGDTFAGAKHSATLESGCQILDHLRELARLRYNQHNLYRWAPRIPTGKIDMRMSILPVGMR
ncbi:hypothetical protein, partial [Streptomyces sp. McG2]|uniref:hypothetical protein n=1 Tax=Streptomyces sp. McG2 TaxID=2725482 RepID=UPI001BE5FD0F